MISLRHSIAALFLLAAALQTPGAAFAQTPTQLHGSLDAFAAPGVALAWAVLRGKDETTAEVVVRIEADPKTYRSLSVTGIDPFTKASSPLLARTPIDGSLTVRLPRSRFAELPRTEWRFHASAAPGASEPPTLMVYYQGVPDTTPEFDDEAQLRASLAQRLERARSEAKTK
jgi:hypothetical protein